MSNKYRGKITKIADTKKLRIALSSSSPVVKKTLSKSKNIVVKTTKIRVKTTKATATKTTKAVKAVHKRVATKPHEKLASKYSWYDKWHQKKYKSVVHVGVLAIYIIVVGLGVFNAYKAAQAAFASPVTWDFSNANDYNVDSDVTLAPNSAKFDTMSYSTDPNTSALYHFDEINGLTASDSSTNGNDLSLTNDNFTTGNLKNALSFNGTDSSAIAPSSPSLSPARDNTLEAWTKLNSSLTAKSRNLPLGIIDKGEYRMFYDNNTGKIVYNIADDSPTSWTLAAGDGSSSSWNKQPKFATYALTKMGSDIYAAIGGNGVGGNNVGQAEVWKWNGSSWLKIGGGNPSVNGSWPALTYSMVVSLVNDGTNVYAGLVGSAGDGEVWKYNGTSWTKIGGDGVNSGWTDYIEGVYAMTFVNGNLYAGLGDSAGDGEVWKYNGTSWTKIGGDGVNSGWTTANNIERVVSLTNDGTDVYAGTGRSAGDADVWKLDTNLNTWSHIGGDGVGGSWASSVFEDVDSLKFSGGKLYAGLGINANDAELWVWNGSTWSKIGGDGVGGSWNISYEQVQAIEINGGDVYVGLGNSNADGEVWKYNGTSWTKIGDTDTANGWTSAYSTFALLYDSGKLYAGTYQSGFPGGSVFNYDGSSWTAIGGNAINGSWDYYSMGNIASTFSYGGYLYAGTSGNAGAALLYRYDGTKWELIGGQETNNSWDRNTYEGVQSIAGYNGKLYVGLGSSQRNASRQDGEVWMWNGTTWTQVGGGGTQSSWPTLNGHYYEVETLISDNNYLYASLGRAGGDGEIWRYNGTTWQQIGGDSLFGGNGTVNNWTNASTVIYAMSIFKGKLYAGVTTSFGGGGNKAQVWQWNESDSNWTQIGGQIGSDWNPSTPYSPYIYSMTATADKLYIGLGNTSGGTYMANVWSWDGSTWGHIGGDGVNNSWPAGTTQRVRSLATFNGNLYAGLGFTAGTGQLWKWNGSSWENVGGNGMNNGWSSGVEEVGTQTIYRGKLYVGTGLSGNNDGNLWSIGGDGYLESSIDTFDTNWHHIAGTYDGSTMKIFIDGNLDAQKTVSLNIPHTSTPLKIGSINNGYLQGSFDGLVDEVRISNSARTQFTTKPYYVGMRTISTKTAVNKTGVRQWSSFSDNTNANGGSVAYRLSTDDGNTWQYWDGGAWVDSNSPSNSNDSTTINSHISAIPVTFQGLKWQAVMNGNGDQQVTINNVTVTAIQDNTPPSQNATNLTAAKVKLGDTLTDGAWTNGGSPYFSWSPAVDSESGIAGYCLYFGTDNTANPSTTKGMLGNSPLNTGGSCQFMVSSTDLDLATAGYLASPLVSSNSAYYLRIKAIDKAGNTTTGTAQFSFKFDNTPPKNPDFITAPSGFVKNKDVTLTWQTTGGVSPSDSNSGLSGLQYKIGQSGTWYGINHDGSGSTSDLLPNSGNYTFIPSPDFDNLQEGINTIYFRTWDQAGNVSPNYISAVVKINSNGSPSEPQNVTATPSVNTTNSFGFSWQKPANFVGDADKLTYCYTINTLPSESTCAYTGSGATNLPNAPYATQPGSNVFYIVAKDEAGNINYDSYSQTAFTANTPAPGIPKNTDVVDVSVKATNNWRLALTWEEPDYTGGGIASYKLDRSADGGQTWTFVGSSSSTTYIDANLSQQTYKYRVKACDSANNCGALGTTVNGFPTGKFTSPANMVADPEAGNITTKKARISWSTDRASDSKIAIGTTSGHYSSSEIGNSDQVSAHQIDLDNLAAGTTYYYVAKWTDEDGNTGTSQEFTFTTAPAPALKEVTTPRVTLNGATVKFTSTNAAKADLLFGKSESFGGIQSVNTSLSESSYSIDLPGLDDGTKYLYKIITYDADGNKYDGSIFSFSTPARPHISNLRFQPVSGEPTSTQEVTWTTNVPSSSLVSYGKVGATKIDSSLSESVTEHKIIIRNLEDDSQYELVAQSRDGEGNLATSDTQSFHTALDTRPPIISDISVESTIRGVGAEARGQIVVSWHTDELSTSQVAYGEGADTVTLTNKSAEDTALSTEHVVIISDLPTSKVYTVQPISRDKANNSGAGESQSAIIGRASDSVLTIILNTLKGIFGF